MEILRTILLAGMWLGGGYIVNKIIDRKLITIREQLRLSREKDRAHKA